MNLTQLKYFRAVCMMGSVSAAAEELHISQPSLSAAIKELETEFGVPLFKRHYKGMALTSAGEELNKLAESLLTHSDQVVRVMNDLGVGRKSLRLGVPPMIGSVTLSRIYREFTPNHPEVQLEITEAGRHELMRLLADNRLDMLLLPHNTEFGKEFKAQQVAKFEIVCCLNRARTVTTEKNVTAKDLDGEPLVLFNDGFFQTQEIKKWFSQSGVEPKILLQTSQLSTLQNVISSGIASGFMFRELISDNPMLKVISMDKPISATVSLVWKANATLYSSMKSFLDYVKNF